MGRGPVIALSGPPGSGKTTYSRRLAEDLNLRYVSAGSIFREIAKSKGLTLEELSGVAARDPSIDFEIDKNTLKEAMKGNVVLDGHLTAWIVRHIADYKVYITAPLLVRVKRISERDHVPFYKALRETIAREWSQKLRFMEYYGLDVSDTSWFDLVISTEKLGIEEAYYIIKSAVKSALKTKSFNPS